MERWGPERVVGEGRLAEALALIRESFAYMEGRIDPPSSMHRLTLEKLGAKEVWGIGTPLVAVVVFEARGDALYLGKLAVASSMRGKGLARAMVDLAVARARALGLAAVELETRIELLENHAAFRRLGFEIVGEGSHAGYERATYVLMRRAV